MNSKIRHIILLLVLCILALGCNCDEDLSPEINTSSFIDQRDGQRYKTVTIGSQTWMAENLNYSGIANRVYNDEESYADLHGRLYTWEVATRACPSGWHLPSDEEWKTLERTLGMSKSESNDKYFRGTDEGSKLKTVDYWTNWSVCNGTNESEFSALPSSCYVVAGFYGFIGTNAYFWTSTSTYNGNFAWIRNLRFGSCGVNRDDYHLKTHHYSVRCVKD